MCSDSIKAKLQGTKFIPHTKWHVLSLKSHISPRSQNVSTTSLRYRCMCNHKHTNTTQYMPTSCTFIECDIQRKQITASTTIHVIPRARRGLHARTRDNACRTYEDRAHTFTGEFSQCPAKEASLGRKEREYKAIIHSNVLHMD